MAGDVRANENAALQSLQILFAREHNRKAREFRSLYPFWNDNAYVASNYPDV
jgi:hypothetical protein